MKTRDVGPAFEAFTAAAAAVARERPGVDAETARELLQEAAVMLHNGLAFDGLDEHDLPVVVGLLATDLTAADPIEAVRARAASGEGGETLHDPSAVGVVYRETLRILRL